MKKKLLALALVMLFMSAGLFAAKKPQTKIQNYVSLVGGGADFALSFKVNSRMSI